MDIMSHLGTVQRLPRSHWPPWEDTSLLFGVTVFFPGLPQCSPENLASILAPLVYPHGKLIHPVCKPGTPRAHWAQRRGCQEGTGLQVKTPASSLASLLFSMACLNITLKARHLVCIPRGHTYHFEVPSRKRHEPWVPAKDAWSPPGTAQRLPGKHWPPRQDPSLLFSLTAFFPRLLQCPPGSLASHPRFPKAFFQLWGTLPWRDMHSECKPGIPQTPSPSAGAVGKALCSKR